MYEGALQELIDALGTLPGIGPRSAQRIAFHLLDAPTEDVNHLADALRELKLRAKFCEVCFNVSTEDKCAICRDPRRDHSYLCVVEESKDVMAIERTREFRGLYHVLGGTISPIDGRGPSDLHIRELFVRLQDPAISEVILATDPTVDGEATATYLTRQLAPTGVTVSRLASGLPVGGDLEYADEVTLGRAFEGRRVVASPPAAQV
ncbi:MULTISPECIES: recombination mediator RecR [Aestuariimicrobium]|uniref:recombination mediator RecR n=1 Tax=Aestuariimicrobium TaxID=396388 RepID=UPI0003B5872E|nr:MULTISPECIES: recombination mediator RecR [Aestuariimicrobium]CAI9402045.1 Recombination protein RecR [Aestuariimicrobium sp. T2.26MG-19.2B]